MDIISTDAQECKNNVINGVQVLNRIISLNHRPITILVPNDGITVKEETVHNTRQKIPRPANAFMLFANENRKKLAKSHPQESNKEISIRLGTQWKTLNSTLKEKYFTMAKEVDADHKRKYPDYVYNPKEARIRKAMRDRERSMGVSSMGNSQRTRRANWPRQSPHMPTPHNEHNMMSTPSKDLRSVLRNELEHGFLANNSNYVYPAQQYLFSPQPDYAAYINSISSWNPTNTYNLQGNPSVQQQIWNQYQADRARASQSQGSAYLMSHPQSQPPDYHQHVEHMPSGNMMQMGHVQKPSIHQNLENAASDVDRYLNMSTSMNIPRSSSTVSLEMTSHLPPNNSQHTSVTNSRASDNIGTMLENTISSHVSNPGLPETQTVPPISDIDTTTTPHESTCNTDANISNVTSMSEVDAAINLENTTDNTESGFSGMSVFDDEEIANVNAQEVRKGIHSTNNKIFRLKPEVFETVPNSYYTMDKQIISPPFISPQAPCCVDFLNVDTNNNVKKPDYPIHFSTPKYYDTPSCDNYDLPIIATDQFGGFICDDGYGLLNFQNQPEMPPTYTFAPNQIEMSQFLNDPCEILPIDLGSVKSEENCILDLSKMADTEEVIDVGVENCSAEKLVEVSNKICEELAKII